MSTANLMPFDDRDGEIWMDGAFVPWRQATIHVINHGLHYGSSVFEGERVYGGRIFKAREHHERFLKSAEMLRMEIPYSVAEIDEAAEEAVRRNKIENGYVRPVAWRGSEQMGIAPAGTKTHVAIAAWSWPEYFPDELKQKGIRLVTSPWRRPPPESAPVQAKAGGLYVISTLSRQYAEDEGAHDALMLDMNGNVAEASCANIFFVKDGVLHTPTPDCFLNGVTRQTVIALAEEASIEVIVRHIKPEELADFQECFITGTAAGVTAVGQIDDHCYSVGPIVRQLREAYEALTTA